MTDASEGTASSNGHGIASSGPPPLPATGAEWVRTIKQQPTLNDLVEGLVKALAADEGFKRLIEATSDAAAVTGDTAFDDCLAAQMIHQEATNTGSPVAKENFKSIATALGVVLRRYKLDRKYRASLIGGQPLLDNGQQ